MSHLGLVLPLDEDKVEEYGKVAQKYAVLCGAIVGRRAPSDPPAVPTPLTLLPTPVPENSWHQLCRLQAAFSELYHQVAHDFNFLQTHLKPIAEVDGFFSRLWQIHEAVKNQPQHEHRCLMLARNDFMLSGESGQPKQIEMNTISVGGGCLGQRVRDYHAWLLRTMGCGNLQHKFPISKLDENFAEEMLKAVKMYNAPGSVILFVVEENDYYDYDQLLLEKEIFRQDQTIRVLHRTVKQVDTTGNLKGGKLFVDGDEVALVYYRTLSSNVDEYYGEVGWRVRLMLEKSRAVLAPCIHTKLAGSKKIQQVLCKPGVVERYIKDPDLANEIRKTFVNQYPTDQSPEGDYGVQLARANPDKYILKPQREGGGYNFHGSAIVEELDRLGSSEERCKYILMEKIFPPQHDNYLFKEDRLEYGTTVSEIGLFVSSVWEHGSATGRYCGDYLRTKWSHQEEGGVNFGAGNRGSSFLV